MWEFLQDPQAVGGGILSAAIGALSIYLRILEWRNKQRLAKAASIPPTALPVSEISREITGAHQAIRELRTAIEQETAVRRAEWTIDELREQVAELSADCSRTGAALSASNARVALLEAQLDKTLAAKAAYKLALEAEQSKRATLEQALIDSDARTAAKQRELDACERRAGAIALELHNRKHEEASGHDHSVELALSPDPEATITPLRPPPKGSK